jgi:hypothetical protein
MTSTGAPIVPAVGTHLDSMPQLYARWAVGDMGQDDQWGDVTAEPRAVDYTEVSADGVRAVRRRRERPGRQ